MKKRHIVLNRIRCPDNTILTSRYSHEFVKHKQEDGLVFSVDGGTEELYRSYTQGAEYEELSLYDDASHEDIRQGFFWVSRSEDARKISALRELSTEHIQAILDTQKLAEWRSDIFEAELRFRKQIC
ncbi:hypothetical protein [Photobacterium lipolyticum]|uniref:Uncharacterized protein n=1 Tax=Photobacterium lipolyticum TaxID=266810 RepID=A0A2T3MWA9_9GAMM|nr:hypothetical protein [Photobacterium lipolyticum]PSW04189.1 hypothetical protein C9I89_14520 [Photobacterium lipolyticum]